MRRILNDLRPCDAMQVSKIYYIVCSVVVFLTRISTQQVFCLINLCKERNF